MAAARRCIVCDRPGPFAELWSPPGYPGAMVRCPGCGLVFQDPQPTDEELQSSYYHDPEFSRLLLGELREFTVAQARVKMRLLEQARIPLRGARALDVGCSSGAWLELAEEAGMTATGVEVGERTAAQARARGLDVRTGTLSGCLTSLEARSFDLITFWDVLEHVRDPRQELALAKRLLAPGGFIAATFPNVEGLYPRATHALLATRTGVWEYPELPLHLYDFAPQSSRRLLEHAGYSVVAQRTHPIPFAFYRATSLSLERLGASLRGRLLRAVFEGLRLLIYPAARACGRENSLFLAARAAGDGS